MTITWQEEIKVWKLKIETPGRPAMSFFLTPTQAIKLYEMLGEKIEQIKDTNRSNEQKEEK